MNTKKCSQCQVEKPLSDFHRRGNGHQNICKVCRLESSKTSPSSPRVKKDKVVDVASAGVRIVELEPRLRKIARQYSNDGHEANDIYSHICECLLTEIEPTDSDSRILTVAKWRAGGYAHQANTYSFVTAHTAETG